MYTLYWIRCPNHTDHNTQGYIGITKNFNRRMREHQIYPNPILRNAINKYSWDILIKQQLVVDLDEELILLAEEMLRPIDEIGWNIVKGGGKPPIPDGKQAIGNRSRTGMIKFIIEGTDNNNHSIRFHGKNELKSFGFDPSAVYACLNGRLKRHKGYTFTRIPLQ